MQREKLEVTGRVTAVMVILAVCGIGVSAYAFYYVLEHNESTKPDMMYGCTAILLAIMLVVTVGVRKYRLVAFTTTLAMTLLPLMASVFLLSRDYMPDQVLSVFMDS